MLGPQMAMGRCGGPVHEIGIPEFCLQTNSLGALCLRVFAVLAYSLWVAGMWAGVWRVICRHSLAAAKAMAHGCWR